jgi:hypothetical protein
VARAGENAGAISEEGCSTGGVYGFLVAVVEAGRVVGGSFDAVAKLGEDLAEAGGGRSLGGGGRRLVGSTLGWGSGKGLGLGGRTPV